MMLIDTHTHLFSEQFDDDRDNVISRALDLGITKFLLPNIDLKTIDAMHNLVNQYPESCFPMMGLHPCSVKETYKNDLDVIESHLFSNQYVAVGEIGLDYHWDTTFAKEQKEVFVQHIEWAKQMELPVAIHCRESMQDILEILGRRSDDKLNGLLHCFSGNIEEAKQLIDLGFYLGIGGVITFKNSGLDKVIEQVDLKHLVLETDSPYLAPTPFRGKRNESAYLINVAEKLSEIKNVSIEETARITSENAQKLFNFN